MKNYQKLFLLTFTVAIVMPSCNNGLSDNSTDISNITFTPQSLGSSSRLLIEWDSTDPTDMAEVSILAPGYQSIEASNGTSVALQLPANNYEFYVINSDEEEFGPFNYTYNPMVHSVDVATNDEGAKGVKFNFQNDANFSQPILFEVEYGVEDFVLGNGSTESILNNLENVDESTVEFLAVEDIIPDNTHDFYIRSVYAETGSSEWFGPYKVEFPLDYLVCSPPELQSVNIIDDSFGNPSSAQISFNETGLRYQVSIVNSLNADPNNGNIISTDSTTFTFVQISSNTDYFFALKTICIDGSTTAWSEIYTFNTGS